MAHSHHWSSGSLDEKQSTDTDSTSFDFDTWIIDNGLAAIKDAFIDRLLTTVDTIKMSDYSSYNSLITHRQVFTHQHMIPQMLRAIESLNANPSQATPPPFDFDAWIQQNGLNSVKHAFVKHGMTSLRTLYMDNNTNFAALIAEADVVHSGLLSPIIQAINSLHAMRKIEQPAPPQTESDDTKNDEHIIFNEMRKYIKHFDDLQDEYKTMSDEYEQKKDENNQRIKQHVTSCHCALDAVTEKVATSMDTLQQLLTKKHNLLKAKTNEYKREIAAVEEAEQARQKELDLVSEAMKQCIENEQKHFMLRCENTTGKYGSERVEAREHFNEKSKQIEDMKGKLSAFVKREPVEFEEKEELYSLRVNDTLLDDIWKDIDEYVSFSDVAAQENTAVKQSRNQQISNLVSMNQCLQLQRIEKKKEKEALVSQNKKQGNEIRSLQQERDALTADRAKQQRQITALTAKTQALKTEQQEQINSLRLEIKKRDSSITQKDTQIVELWNKGINHHSVVRKLEDEIAKIQDERSRLVQDVQSARKQQSALKQEIANSAQNSKSIESKLEEVMQQNDALKQRQIELNDNNQTLRAQVAKFEAVVNGRCLKLLFCDEKTGDIDVKNGRRPITILEYSDEWTLKQIAAYFEDQIEWKRAQNAHINQNTPYVHIWCRFKDIKRLYLVQTKRLSVTLQDLQNEDPDSWKEVPDDRLKVRLKSYATKNIELAIEIKRKDGTWPRATVNEQSLQLRVGDIIDAKDFTHQWFESVVRCVNPQRGTFGVHYIGWAEKYDEELHIQRDARRMARRHTHTEGPMRSDNFLQFHRIDIMQTESTQSAVRKSEEEAKSTKTENAKLQSRVSSLQQHIKQLKEINTSLRNQVNAMTVSENTNLDDDEKQGIPDETSLSPRGGLVGLRNIGNTCFMNSIIQSLAHLPKLAAYFVTNQKLTGNVSRAFGNLLQRIWNEDDLDSSSLRSFVHAMSSVSSKYGEYNMQDPAEFLDYLLNAIHDELNTAANASLEHNEEDKIEANGMPDEIISNISWECYTKNNRSIIIDLFYGQEKSTTICANPKCQHKFVIFEPFKVLHLSTTINQRNQSSYNWLSKGKKSKLSLSDCLDDYVAEKQVLDTWYCKQCQQDLPGAMEKTDLFRFPQILVIHFKKQEMQDKSKQVRVDYPVMKLDLSSYNLRSQRGPMYDLYSVSCLSGHHCTAYARGHKNNNKFFHFNDNSVRNVKQKEVIAQNAYLLFYQRRD